MPLAEVSPAAHRADWYADWQSLRHVERFDHRAGLKLGSLIRNFESYNDVRLLKELASPQQPLHLLEVGCATGEFYRYLRFRYRDLRYSGLDISRAAISRAKEKHPQARFGVADPLRTLAWNIESLGLDRLFPVVYSKDVLHHQVDPWSFLRELLLATRDLLILRTRTRDRGESVLDPETSCQYHYGGWIPYLIFNLEELIGEIRRNLPRSQITLYRNRMILGGLKSRYLPKDCYLPETGTAETALAVQIHGDHPGEVRLEDRKDMEGTPHRIGWLWGAFQRIRR